MTQGLVGLLSKKSMFSREKPCKAFVSFGDLAGEIILGEAMSTVRLVPLSKYLREGTMLELWDLNIDEGHLKVALLGLFRLVSGRASKKENLHYVYNFLNAVGFDIFFRRASPEDLKMLFLSSPRTRRIAISDYHTSDMIWIDHNES